MIVTTNTLFKTKTPLAECLWLTVNNPNYIGLQRRDYEVISLTVGVPQVLTMINVVGIVQADFETDFAVGSSFYLSNINATVTVDHVTWVNPVFAYVYWTRDGQSILSYTTGFANCFSRVDYYAELIMGFIDPETTLKYSAIKVIPFSDGSASVDISNSMQTFLTLKGTNEDYDVVNKRDANISGRFFLNYREYYSGEYTATGTLTPTFYAVNNQKKSLEVYGSCLAEYELQLESSNKFLTRMVQPNYWEGYPFDLSFIYSNLLRLVYLKRKEVDKNINETTLSTITTDLLVFNPNENYAFVNRLTLSGSFIGSYVDVSIYAPVTIGFTLNGYATNYAGNYFKTHSIGSLVVEKLVSEVKRLRIGDCQDSPAYLRWRNSLGGFEYWLFGTRQVKNNEVDKFDVFNPLITDIETQQEKEVVITKDYNKSWTLGAYLTMVQVKDIQELFTSPFVQYWDGVNWFNVIIKSGSYLEEITDETHQEIEFDIMFPKEYKQWQ